MSKPNIPDVEMEIEDTAPAHVERMEFTESAQTAIDRQKEVESQFDDRKKEKELVVPTRDELVKARLRELEEPICLFGEIAGDRRDRLKKILLREGITQGMPQDIAISVVDTVQEITEAFLTEGTDQLKRAREYIAKRSLLRARRRLGEAREVFESEAKQKEQGKTFDASINEGRKFTCQSSQVGGDRPVTSVGFNNGEDLRLATGSWNGAMSLWSIPDCKRLLDYQGHEHRVCDVSFHPHSGVDMAENIVQLASASADKTIALWSLDNTAPIAVLQGHADRVNKAIFHPFGRHLISVSFDKTWRMWDVETCQELLLQEGHSRSVYTGAIQPDGSIVATAGLDSRVVVWDLRSGRSLWTYTGHNKPILALDWSPNGFLLATGSEDNTCKLVDVRMRRTLYTIPAHNSLVSGVKYEPTLGALLVTCSFDSHIHVWDAVSTTHAQIKSLSVHDGRVMSVDISRGGKYIASAGYDRTWKLFSTT